MSQVCLAPLHQLGSQGSEQRGYVGARERGASGQIMSGKVFVQLPRPSRAGVLPSPPRVSYLLTLLLSKTCSDNHS